MQLPIETLIQANNTSYSEIEALTGIKKHKLLSYGYASELTRFKTHIKLLKAGYVIPFHHRPRCRICKHYFIPKEYRHYDCPECVPVPNHQVSYSPCDLMELGFGFEEALDVLGLPQDKKLWTWLDNFHVFEEDTHIEALKHLLGEK